MNAAMGSLVGGCDHYGHVVWAEKLGDIASIVDHPVSLEEAQAIRMKVMEVVQQVQAQRSLARGVRRYKQIYILDLAHVSLAHKSGVSLVRSRDAQSADTRTLLKKKLESSRVRVLVFRVDIYVSAGRC